MSKRAVQGSLERQRLRIDELEWTEHRSYKVTRKKCKPRPERRRGKRRRKY